MPRLTDLLAAPPASFIKDADVESPDETQLEQDFANMAFVFLRDRAPGLMPYLLGFEVVDREEDGSRAVGIFGFKISGSYYYVPTFFVNKQIKGMDLLFSKKTNSFVPLRETWINHIVDRAAVRLGDGAGGGGAQNKLREDFESPSFDFLSQPPGAGKMATYTGKVAAYLPALATKWAGDFDAKRLSELKARQATLTPEEQAELADLEAGHAAPDEMQASDNKVAAAGKNTSGKQCFDCGAMPGRQHKPGCEEGQHGPLHVPPDSDPGWEAAARRLDKQAEWTPGQCFTFWNELQGAVKEATQNDADFRMALAGAIATLKHTPLDDMRKSADGSPLFAYLQTHGGLRGVHAIAKTAHDNLAYANALLTFYPSVTSLVPKEYEATAMPKQAASISVQAVSDSAGLPSASTDKERQRMVRDGFTLIDRRPAAAKSETFDVAYDKQYTNPDVSGSYELLLPSGSCAKAWVLLPAGGQPGTGVTVVEPKNRFYFTADTTRVFVRGDKLDEKTPYDAAVGLDKMLAGKRYVLVDAKGNASAPFRVSATVSENGERTRLRVNFSTYVDHKPAREDTFYPGAGGFERDPEYLQLAPIPEGRLRMVGMDLIVPENWKALKLVDKYEYSDSCCTPASDGATDVPAAGPDVARNMYDAFAPGSPLDVEEALGKNAIHRLTVENPDGGSDYYLALDDFSMGPCGYRTALTQLVTKLGMAVDDAEDRLATAQRQMKVRCLIKLGQYGGVGVGMNMPQDPGYAGADPDTGALITEPFNGSATGELLGVPPLQDATRPGFAIGGQTEREIGGMSGGGGDSDGLGNDVAALAQQAAATGQKNVFDHSTIGGLARLYDASAAIDQYLPDLLKALDRLGRVLFIFYWKNEDFAERYGEEDLAEMEDLFRGVFKSFGDLVLKLKQKSVATEDNKEMLTL